MAGATFPWSILLFSTVGIAIFQSPSSSANLSVVGELKDLRVELSTKSGKAANLTSNASGLAPVLESQFAALRDHLKDATSVLLKPEAQNVVAKADAIIAKAENQTVVAAAPQAVDFSHVAEAGKAVVTAGKAVEAAIKPVEVAIKPVEAAPKASNIVCECAPGAVCPAVCTVGVNISQLNKVATNTSASKTNDTIQVATTAAVSAAAPVQDDKMPPVEANWSNFANQVSGFANVQTASFVHDGISVRGVAASKDLKKGDTVLEVQADLTLSKENSALRRFFGNVKMEDPDSTWRLVSFVALEKKLGAQSPWAMFFQHLPSADFFKQNHPLWGEKALLEKFAPLPMLHEVHKYQKMFKEDWRIWKRFVKAVDQKPELFVAEKGLPPHVRLLRQAVDNVTKDDLFWAFTVVLTRGFSTAHGTALAPVADDFNTDLAVQQNAQWHAEPGGALKIFTTHDVKKGQEILLNYAGKPIDNEKFAAVWGFVFMKNNVGVSKLAFEDCQALDDRLVWKAKKTMLRTGYANPTQKFGNCVAPASEKQPGIYCTLMELVKEHCPYIKDLQ